jgi:hypothetical protein
LYQILAELDALDAEKKKLEKPEPSKTEGEDKPKEN